MSKLFIIGMIMALPPWGYIMPANLQTIGLIVQAVGLIIMLMEYIIAKKSR